MRPMRFVFLLLVLPRLWADTPPRPFMLWTAAEIQSMRDRLEAEPWYADLAEATIAKPDPQEKVLLDLWLHAVKDDADAGERQRKRLLQVVRSAPPLGLSQWLTVLRYDLLNGMLDETERAEVEACFRDYIEHAVFRNSLFDPGVFNDERNFSRYQAHFQRQENWLPNIVFPQVLSANLMAAALGDEELIRRVWDQHGSFRWYIDDYLSDGGFYGEEFGKMNALPGEMLVYCLALDHLGLSELGFDYPGRHGASMRGHLESLVRLGLPKIDLHSGRPQIPRLIIGDLRGGPRYARPLNLLQDSLVAGYLPNGQGGSARWQTAGAWGGEIRGKSPQWDGYSGFTPKMQWPLWFEIAHRRWPHAGFDYFLSQETDPGGEGYRPSLYFGCPPLGPGDTRPPRAPSWVAERRGLALLRAEESPAYWDSPKPAVGLRLAAPYAHSVNDSFALTGFYAFNRPIHLNRHIGGYAENWSRSVLSHAGVKVDGHEPAAHFSTATRHNFQAGLKFVAARSGELYPDIVATRALMLTDSYLLDLFHLEGTTEGERTFRWLVHPLGLAETGGDWSPPQPLRGDLGAGPREAETGTPRRMLAAAQELLDSFGTARVLRTDGDWHLRVTQRSPVEASLRILPPAWYEREVGVDLRMAAGEGTVLLLSDTPTVHHDPAQRPSMEENPGAYETGGVSLQVVRKGRGTTYAAVHEPFEGGQGKIARFAEIAKGEGWGAWRIGGEGQSVDDRAYLRFDSSREPITVRDGETEILFADHALLRRTERGVEVFGDVRSIRIPAADPETRLYHNGRLSPSTHAEGMLVYASPRG